MRQALGRLREAMHLIFRKYPCLNRTADYDTYWQEKRSGAWKLTAFQRNRLGIVNRFVAKGDAILDVGVGDPSVLEYVLRSTGASSATAIDVSPNVVRECRKRGIRAFLRNTERKDFLNGIERSDVALVLELLEHVKDSEAILELLLKNTRKYVIFSIPNTGYFAHRLRLLFGSFPLQWVVHPSEHIRFWTLRDLRWWLRELKLDRRSTIIPYEGIPGLNGIFPGWFSMGFVVVVRVGRKHER